MAGLTRGKGGRRGLGELIGRCWGGEKHRSAERNEPMRHFLSVMTPSDHL